MSDRKIATPTAAVEWINQQQELRICVRTMLVGPLVRIYYGHRMIGTGETLEEAVTAAMKNHQPPRPPSKRSDR